MTGTQIKEVLVIIHAREESAFDGGPMQPECAYEDRDGQSIERCSGYIHGDRKCGARSSERAYQHAPTQTTNAITVRVESVWAGPDISENILPKAVQVALLIRRGVPAPIPESGQANGKRAAL